MFAAVDTLEARAASDTLCLFNPNLVPAPIVVQFITTAGSVTGRTYLVGPLQYQVVDVGSVEPNAQLGLMAASSYEFVALNRYSFNHGRGGATSPGMRG
jgi:hypothetical protein